MSNKKIISNNACVVMPLLLRLAAILLIAALMVSPVISPAFGRAAARQTNRDVKIRASAGVVMNADTGEVLYSKKGQHRYYPASCTKILTALVALETWKGDLSKVLTVSRNAVYGIDPESSHIALDVGERITREQALYALLLASANDAAVVIAEDAGGSEKGFAKKMNAKARSLGLTHSHFVDPHGLYNKAHYTTPQDLAAIMQAALKNKTFVKIFSTISYTIPKTNKSKKRVLWNNHRMIRTKYYYYPGVIGGKSGYITKSRFNLVTVCRKKGMHLIVAVMHGSTAEDMVKDTKKLLDYYYDHYHAVTVPVQASGISVAGIKNVKTSLSGGSLSVIVPKSVSKDNLKTAVRIKHMRLPIEKGETIGTIDLMENGQVLASTKIKSAERLTIWDSSMFRIFLCSAGAVIILAALLAVTRRRKHAKPRKKKRK